MMFAIADIENQFCKALSRPRSSGVTLEKNFQFTFEQYIAMC